MLAFKGKDFICIAADSRTGSSEGHRIYGNDHNKIKTYCEGKIAMLHDMFYADADYVDRLCRAMSKQFVFDHGHEMSPKNFASLLGTIGFRRSRNLFLYTNSFICGFEPIHQDGNEVLVPKIYCASFGGCLGEENFIACGQASNYMTSCLNSFVGNRIMYSADREPLSEDDAIGVAKSILKSVSAKEVSTGGTGHIKILRRDGFSRQETFDLKQD